MGGCGCVLPCNHKRTWIYLYVRIHTNIRRERETHTHSHIHTTTHNHITQATHDLKRFDDANPQTSARDSRVSAASTAVHRCHGSTGTQRGGAPAREMLADMRALGAQYQSLSRRLERFSRQLQGRIAQGPKFSHAGGPRAHKRKDV